MKKILLSIFSLATIGFVAKVEAQNCTIQNVVINVNGTPQVVPGGLSVNFNATFDLDANSGNKYLFIQSWLTTQWPNYWECLNGVAELNPKKGPKAADLINSFLRLSINNDVVAPAQPSFTTYGFDGTVTMSNATSVSKVYNAVTVAGITYDRFTLTGVSVILPGITDPNAPISVTTDVFSTNGQVGGPNSPIHCVNCGVRQFFNDPVISGFKPCVVPRVLNFGVVVNSAVPASFTYQIYRDVAPFGVYDGNDVNVTLTAPNSDVINITTLGNPGQVGRSVSFTGANAIGEGSDYWVVVTPVGGGSNAVARLFTHGSCFLLPVDFTSFTAARNRSNVLLKWETSSEQNNRGFGVERNIGNNSWQEVAFVPTQAAGGNSASLLSYQYVDFNEAKSMTQYRIRQVDTDNRSKYTPVRSIRGLDQGGGIIVYPNPTVDGKVNVVFEETTSIKNISVMDMSGKTLKQINGISSNSIVIDNLNPGMYTLRVFVPATGEQSVQKIVVNKR